MREMTGFRWRRGVTAFLLALPMATMAGCDEPSPVAAGSTIEPVTGLDSHGREACAEFRAGRRQTTDTSARLLFADAVGRPARRSDNTRITESAAAMGRSAKDGGRAWRVATDDLQKACGQARSDTGRPTLPVTG